MKIQIPSNAIESEDGLSYPSTLWDGTFKESDLGSKVWVIYAALRLFMPESRIDRWSFYRAALKTPNDKHLVSGLVLTTFDNLTRSAKEFGLNLYYEEGLVGVWSDHEKPTPVLIADILPNGTVADSYKTHASLFTVGSVIQDLSGELYRMIAKSNDVILCTRLDLPFLAD